MILLDAGHGGYIEGETQTPNRGIYGELESFSEGQYNRMIVHGIAFRLSSMNIPIHIVCPENQDKSLPTRATRINKICRKHGRLNCFLLSVHQNGFSNSSVKGFELFTSPGHTDSDQYAEIIAKLFGSLFPERKKRWWKESKRAKEARYYILRRTICPAVLTEWGFMTNPSEQALLKSDRGIMEQINFLADVCANIYLDHLKPNQEK